MRTMIRRDLKEVMADLPEVCCIKPSEDDDYVMVKRGVQGYFPMHPRIDPEQFNKDIGLTAAQREAMLAGSMFGFDVPGADPQNWQKRLERVGRA